MIPASRRAPSALRALAFAATPSRCIRRPVLPRLPSQIKCIIPQSRRCFSSMYPRFQEAAAQELQEDAGQQEYTQFEELAQHGLISPRVIETLTQRMNIHTMTDVQRMTLNHCLDGSDVIAQARTGTGKTLAFLMPIVQRILRDKNLENTSRNRASVGDIRALIITPTRELAEQIAVEAKKIVANTSVKVQTAVGGTQKSMHLRQMQNQGCHILVGTPGRVQDIISDRSTGVSLDNIETFVLDEADRLLDIGFAPAIAEIQTFMPPRHEKNRQTLMFSATVPKSVVQLVRDTLRPDFKFIRTVDPNEAPTHARIPQKVVFGRGLQNQIPIIMEIAYNAIQAHKKDPSNQMPFKAIVYFGSTAEVAMAFDAFSKMRDPEMPRSIFQPHPLDPCRIFQMHGKLAQAQRTRETDGFRRAQSGLLFSSDVTARGMDFPDVSHIIQIGLPKSSDDYVHRLGRTGRAGKNGEGWLILNEDERREINYKMRNSGINLTDAELVTASLDMTRGAQIPGHIAKLLKYVEVGVKSVSYNVKAATYQALLGVLPQQNPNRPKAQQVELMNELAKFGWGMQEPPPIARNLAAKIGILNVPGVRLDDGPQRRDDRDGGRGGFGGRGGYGGRGGFGDRGGFSDRGDGGRDGGRFNDRAPSSQEAGRGVFGGGSRGGDAFDQLGLGGGEDRRGGGRGGRGGGRDSGRGGGSRGGRSRF